MIEKKMISAPGWVWSKHITPYLKNIGINVPQGTFDFSIFIKNMNFRRLLMQLEEGKKRALCRLLLEDQGVVIEKIEGSYTFKTINGEKTSEFLESIVYYNNRTDVVTVEQEEKEEELIEAQQEKVMQ